MVYSASTIFGVVSLYWFVSITLVFVNKWLLGDPSKIFDGPLFVTWFQCLTTVALCVLLSMLSRLFPNTITFPSIDFSPTTAFKVMPLSLVFFIMIACNNYCLKYLDVAFYFVARSLTTIFNVILTYCVLKKETPFKSLLCCGLIILGYITSVAEENVFGSLSLSGLFFGLSASLAVAVFSILTSKGLEHVGGSVWRLTFYNNLNSSLLFALGILLTELKEFEFLPPFFSSSGLQFWGFLCVSGLFGFLISYVTTWQIQVTSPLTHNISGTAKAAAQTIIAAVFSRNLKSSLWWLGNCMVVVGSIAYAYVRHQFSLKQKVEKTSNLEKVTITKA